MPPLFNILVCILACVIGYLIGRTYRRNHKAKKNPNYTREGKIDMSRYKNLTALHEKMEKRSEEKASASHSKSTHKSKS